MKIIERIPAHYETQEVEDLGRVYRWCPEQVVLQCGACGTRKTFERSSLIASLVKWVRALPFGARAVRTR